LIIGRWRPGSPLGGDLDDRRGTDTVRMPDLHHIRGTRGLPILGLAPAFAADALGLTRSLRTKFGPIVRGYYPFEPHVLALSAHANEQILLDRENCYSSKLGWEPLIGVLFRGGLVLRDGSDHRLQRRIMQQMFRKEALATYLKRMMPRIQISVADWGRRGSLAFHPAVKRLTLEIAAEIFLGLDLQAEIDQVNRDFIAAVDASLAIVRLPGIGIKYQRGIRARARLETFVRSRIPERRRGNREDMFSRICRAEAESGGLFREHDIADQIIFLLMAAHETTSSAISTMIYMLATHPEWQDRLHQEALAVGTSPLKLRDLDQMQCTRWVLFESLRLYPPLPSLPRRTLRDSEVHGVAIPAGTPIGLYPIFAHRDHEWWTNPDAFDPERFSPSRGEDKRHPYAWIPFGAGVHMCLGMSFAEMQVKAVLHELLRRYRVHVSAGYEASYQLVPIPRPKDGLPIFLTRR
jgi:cytochrome P450